MAILEAGSSSDAAPASQGEYDVFLNFRGKDTRHGFTDFLYDRLVDTGIRVFRDEEELPVGEVISERLQQAIKNTIIYIPIFSPTYASSKWCLRELVLMVDQVSESEDQKSIIPIFFHVEPDDVKLKKPLYKADFQKHEKNFRDEVEAWKRALEEVDERKGLVVKKDQSQAAIVKSIVREALEKLKIKQKSMTEHLVGLDDRVKHLIEFLDVSHDDVRLIGIHGMGGIGKTTIAKVVFNQLCSHFGKYCSFLEGVREKLTKNGIVKLQKKLLSDIIGPGSIEKVEDSEHGMRMIGRMLSNKKVLVVLDDVDKKEHIKKLTGNYSLYSGSRIIITTRDTTTLQVEGFKGEIQWYEMQKMDDDDALQLFYRHAFGRNFPLDDYSRLSSEIVSSTGGLPLAIEVMGSLLNGKDQEFWEETLVRLIDAPEEKIQETLRISYNDLDIYQQQIFLDIVHFYLYKTDAIYIWANCQFYPIRGIEVLNKRSLIKEDEDDMLWTHDQLINLGRQIVREESPSNLGNHSRLSITNEDLEIIRTGERKDKVQTLEIYGLDDHIVLTNEDFERLPNLRLLYLCNGTVAGDFANCHSKLKLFYWRPPMEDFRAYNMYLDHLVVFRLYSNCFTDESRAWDLIKRARNLKALYLSQCDGITTIPDFSNCLGLERLTIANCRRLQRIESFIGDLRSLIKLDIEECMDLTYLPKEVGALVNLKHFSLSTCSRLRKLPRSIRELTSLTELNLSGTGITKLPNSIEKLTSLCALRLSKDGSYSPEHYVWQLTRDISMLKNLKELDLSGNNELVGEIPVGIGELLSLRILNLERTHICGIPRTINMLHHLQALNLKDCHEIQELPELPTSLTSLRLRSTLLLSVPNLSNLTNLVELLLSDGSCSENKSNLEPGHNLKWIGRLSRLEWLDLNLQNVPAPPELASLSHLEELTLGHLDLETLVQLPSCLLSFKLQFFTIRGTKLLPSFLGLRNLLTLELCYSEVEDIPLDGLPQLEKLIVDNCKLLQRLSVPLELSELREATVSSCPDLVEIQVLGLLKSLESFFVWDCIFLKKIGGLSYLKNLNILKIDRCNALTNVEGLDDLKSLESLIVTTCTSLRRLIDPSCTYIPDDCLVEIQGCGDFIKNSAPTSQAVTVWDEKTDILTTQQTLKQYREGILPNSSNSESKLDKVDPVTPQMEHPFTIIFHLGVEKSSEEFKFVGEIQRNKKDVTPHLVSYAGLTADVKGFGFHLKRMWYMIPGSDGKLHVEIESDEQAKGMVQLATERGFIHLLVEGGIDICLEGAKIRASQLGLGCSVHLLLILFALLLFLSLSRIFPAPRFSQFIPGNIR